MRSILRLRVLTPWVSKPYTLDMKKEFVVEITVTSTEVFEFQIFAKDKVAAKCKAIQRFEKMFGYEPSIYNIVTRFGS